MKCGHSTVSDLTFVLLRTLGHDKEAVMLLIVLSKLHIVSYTMMTKYNDDFMILFVYQA